MMLLLLGDASPTKGCLHSRLKAAFVRSLCLRVRSLCLRGCVVAMASMWRRASVETGQDGLSTCVLGTLVGALGPTWTPKLI